MKKMKHLLAVLFIVGATGILGSCDEITEVSENLCGPCGDVYSGDAFISGNAQLDGIFKAVGSLGEATAQIEGSFRADVEGLADAFGVEYTAETSITDLVADVKGAIEGEISMYAEGGISVNFQEPKCEADIDVAFEAQASCEASAGCEVDAECDPGELSVECSGECHGGCEGECTGGSLECKAEVSVSGGCEGRCEGSCELEGPDLECEGTCSGSCTVEASANCTGSCEGNCTGTCDGSTVDGVHCDGTCEGECDLNCTMTGSATCEGTCNGKCEFTPPSGSCSGTCKGECYIETTADIGCEGEPPHCEGHCEGGCTAECNGTVTPPSCSVDVECEATADCQASASAQASANIECTPPKIEIDFGLKAGLDAQAKAEFKAKMEEFKVRMIGIVQGMFKLRALVDADYAAEIGITSPVDAIAAEVQGFVNGGIDDFDVPAGRIACVIPAFEDAADIMISAGTDLVVVIDAQLSLFAVLGV